MFVKWFWEAGPREARHYENLGLLGAPIPELYGSLTDPEGKEVLFLEYLEPICQLHPFDAFVRDVPCFRQFLAVGARGKAGKTLGRPIFRAAWNFLFSS